jgi:hypothetical protein
VLQANAATSELEQYGRQIIGSLVREQILKREYDNHVKQIEDSQAQETFLREKFTNEELYTWMQGELLRTYFDCYKFAFDVANRAEQTLKHEVMRSEFDQLALIKFGYWDSARQGLLAGDASMHRHFSGLHWGRSTVRSSSSRVVGSIPVNRQLTGEARRCVARRAVVGWRPRNRR